ncbi:DUF2971 domain-containing protein [Aeromonas veronii]|nr:DUF2971 domain-containing protein [Aeromonas veronii]
MDILYKYSGLFDLEYFEKPTLKLSVIEQLNDPFEYKHSDDIKEVIINAFEKMPLFQWVKSETDLINGLASDFLLYFKKTIETNGVISFSETPRNSLMWAHYANNHKGMCIGYKSNILRKKSENISDPFFQIDGLLPEKIKYDNHRISLEDKVANIAPAHDMAEIYIGLAKKHLLKKSDEWIYEKEHRIIAPYEITDMIKFDIESKFKSDVSSSTIIEYMLKNNMISKINDKHTYRIEGIPENYLSTIKKREDITFLIDIDLDDIESVYLGCKVNKEDTKNIYMKLKKCGSPIYLYQSKISSTRFEIEHHLVTENTLETLT